MIIKPKIHRGFLCLSAHPEGCAANVQEQIDYVMAQRPISGGPKKALIIGASTGYGLASRIASAFGCRAATLGVFYERPASETRTASAGWYNSVAFEDAADKAGLYAKSINGDAFSEAIKDETVRTIKEELGQVDLVIYSLASPRRTDPTTGETYSSCLKPTEEAFTGKTVNIDKKEIHSITIDPATEEEVLGTEKVMGGEDWELWIDALQKADVLAPAAITVAYSYIGPRVTWPIYRNGTIGAAKAHLEATAKKLDQKLKALGGRAYVSINKAVVTQASSAIPIVPLYISILFKVMKERKIHEGCMEQIYRLYAGLYDKSQLEFDEEGRIRIDDLEMQPDVQESVDQLFEEVTTENLADLSDFSGYQEDFLKLFGFGMPNIDYEKDVEVVRDFKSRDYSKQSLQKAGKTSLIMRIIKKIF